MSYEQIITQIKFFQTLRFISYGIALTCLTFYTCSNDDYPNDKVGCPCDESNLLDFDLNPDIPDIVERWSPIIFHDTDADDQYAELITSVNFDGNWCGADNAENRTKFPLGAVVYYSLVRSKTHNFIGYYFYHPKSNNGSHEHDFEGLIIAVSRSSGLPEALLTIVHGPYVPYVAPWDAWRIKTRKQSGYRDQLDFTLIRQYPTSTGLTYFYDAIAVGVEANTHAVWGAWHNKCIIGSNGSPSGCDNSHGGDGLIYIYKNKAEVPTIFKQFPEWKEYGYELIDIMDLWHKAQKSEYGGHNESTAIFARQQKMPWDTFNSAGRDKGDLPWVWGQDRVIEYYSDGPNILLNPAQIFNIWFKFPPNTFSTNYTNQPYKIISP